MKFPQTKELVGSAKGLGLALGGFIAGNVVSQTVKKDNWKVNGLFTIAMLLVHSVSKKEWAKQLSLGAGIYFGTKTVNNVTTEVVNGLEGVPDSVKSIINKYVPKLNGVDGDEDYRADLSAAEREILLGYMNGGGSESDLLGRANRALPAANRQMPAKSTAQQAFLCRSVNGLF